MARVRRGDLALVLAILLPSACVGVVTAEPDRAEHAATVGSVAEDAGTADASAPDPAALAGPGPEPAPGTEPAPEPEPVRGPDPASIGADELGHVPVLMYHRVVDRPPSQWDVTPEDFRAELVWLFDHGYRPVRMVDLVRGEFDVPAGTTPVVLTFDDSSRSQARLDEDGRIHPDSAIGILIDVASAYDDVDAVASLYVIGSEPFGDATTGPPVLRALADAGFELGNHTMTHPDLGRISDVEVRRELAGVVEVLTGHVPDLEVTTVALPFGSAARDDALVRSGTFDGTSYAHLAVLRVDPEPARSPFHVDFDAAYVPRICSAFGRSGCSRTYGSRAQLTWLDEEPGRRYVSDGDPTRISFPRARFAELLPEHRERANPY